MESKMFNSARRLVFWRVACFFFLIFVSSTSLATDNFINILLPKGVSIDLPRNWMILSSNQRATLDTSIQSRLDLSAIQQPVSQLPFAANLYNDDGVTIGILNLRYYPDMDLTQDNVRSFSKVDVEAFDSMLQEKMREDMQRINMSISSWNGTILKEINGITALISDYRRASLMGLGDFRVRLVRVLNREKSFTLTISYLDSASMLLLPITDRIISSIKIED
jgi:hypothetical protein